MFYLYIVLGAQQGNNDQFEPILKVEIGQGLEWTCFKIRSESTTGYTRLIQESDLNLLTTQLNLEPVEQAGLINSISNLLVPYGTGSRVSSSFRVKLTKQASF